MSAAVLGDEWVAVWRPFAFGRAWADAYGFHQAGTSNPLKGNVRVCSRSDRPHPRLIAALALVRWGARLHTSPRLAALHAATRPLEDSLGDLPDVVSLPVRCAGAGRCEVAVRDGAVVAGSTGDTAEDVARALVHPGRCVVGPAIRRDLVASAGQREPEVALSALLTVDALRSDISSSLALAGPVTSESDLAERWQELSFQTWGMHNYGRFKQSNRYGWPTACSRCGHEVYPRSGHGCHACARYPLGPRRRDSVMDKIERYLAVGR